MCNIIRNGYDFSRVGSSTGNPGVYGDGWYLTSVSNTAKGYGIADDKHKFLKGGKWYAPEAGNIIMVCSTICGNAHKIDVNDVVAYPTVKTSKWTGKGMDHPDTLAATGGVTPHSRIIDKPKAGDYVDECVIFAPEQGLVTHVIVFN